MDEYVQPCLLSSTHRDVYLDLCQSEPALSWYLRAKAEYEQLKQTSTANFGDLLNNIGVIYRRKKYFSAALLYFTRAETIYRRVFPPDHPTLTVCLENISATNAALGNSDAAMLLLLAGVSEGALECEPQGGMQGAERWEMIVVQVERLWTCRFQFSDSNFTPGP